MNVACAFVAPAVKRTAFVWPAFVDAVQANSGANLNMRRTLV
jgi:hypothetical protein